MPTHKLDGFPSRGFLLACVRKYINQRASFILDPDNKWHVRLVDAGLNPNEPIYVNGIFRTLWKRPERWPNDGPITIVLEFRDVLFRQGDVEATLYTADRRVNKRTRISFTLREIRSCRIKDRLECKIGGQNASSLRPVR